MPSPVRSEEHAEPHAGLIGWLAYYRAFTPGTAVDADGTVRLGSSSEPQPDAAIFIRPESGGHVRISADDYVEGGPELVAEVAASSIPLDTGPKFQMYLRYDVQEYIIWRVPAIRRSIGSCAAAGSLCGWTRTPLACIAARSFPAFGWTPLLCCAATWPRSCPYSSKAWPTPNTRRSFPG